MDQRKSGMVFGAGLVVLIIGLLLTAGALAPNHGTARMTIARGGYGVVELPITWNGEVFCRYSVGVDAVSNSYVFTQLQYDSFVSGSVDGYLATDLNNLTANVELPGTANYYIVIENLNAAGALPSTDVEVNYTLYGITVFHMVVGICAIASALIMFHLAFKARKGEGAVSPPDPMALSQSQELWTKRSPQR